MSNNSNKSNKSNNRLKIETPVGVRDYDNNDMIMRNFMLDQIRKTFLLYGGKELDTPIFELKSILMKKYGEESKLIYELDNDKLALRYDLTVPLVRYLVMNKIESGKYFRIGKVYRRDNPVLNKARLREFYQCDFDFVGNSDLMFSDAECITIICNILDCLGIKNYKIKLNNRKIIDSIFKLCKVPKNLKNTITSSIDKLDKHEWIYVENEMKQKGLSEKVILKLEEYFKQPKNLKNLEEILIKQKANIEGINEINKLNEYLEFYKISDKIDFELSLVRGLDYYTGTIYEAVIEGTDIGSIAAGGRYDKLINSLSKMNTPCVGMSIGFERIFLLLSGEQQKKSLADILIVTCGKLDPKYKIKLANMLRSKNFSVEMIYKKKAKTLDQFQNAEDNNIPYCIIIGQDELNKGIYKLRNTITREEKEIPKEKILEELITIFNK